MLKPNNQNSKLDSFTTQKSLSNTPLFLHQLLTLSTNSFKSSLPLQLDSHLYFIKLFFHLDYLRISSNNLTRKKFEILEQTFLFKINNPTINKPCHPCPKIPDNQKYKQKIISKLGIDFYFTKKPKNKGVNTRYAYDVMIDLKGSYLANLSLIEQMELIKYLHSNYRVKCHRLDIALDDYSKSLFPVIQMREAYHRGNNSGFRVIDETCLQVIDSQFKGTLGLGSRRSFSFVRIYTKDELLVRWETELKQKKAQDLFDKIAFLYPDLLQGKLVVKQLLNTLIDTAIGEIDFRDKSQISSPKNRTKLRTTRLPFWQKFLDSIGKFIYSNYDFKFSNIVTKKYLSYLHN